MSGPASGLYLYLWNRADAAEADVTVTGDPAQLASWQASRQDPLGLTASVVDSCRAGLEACPRRALTYPIRQ